LPQRDALVGAEEGMAMLRAFGFALALILAAPSAWASQVCGAQEELASVSFEAELSEGDQFRREVADGLTFMLAPTDYGWKIDVYSRTGANLAELTPPQRMADVNPRALNGWHFRNAENSAPNTGDVNAPQHFRTFVFGPGALDSEMAARNPLRFDDGPEFGRGELEIIELRLTRPRPGQRARMTHLSSRACLEWTPMAAEPLPDGVEPIPLWMVELFDACGLPEGLRLSNHMSWGPYPSVNYLEPDLDGDGAHELVVPIVRQRDLKRGLAVCWRGGERLDLIGLDGELGQHLTADYFDHMDYWSVHERREVGQGIAEGAPPTLNGDGLTIGKEGASSVLVYYAADGFNSYWQGD
jgi:hypothetical protein